MDLINSFGLWLGTFFILAVLSYVYKENVFYRFGEYSFVSISLAVQAVSSYKSIIGTCITPMSVGRYVMIIPFFLGLALFLRYYRKLAFIPRWSIALMTGVGSGLAIRGLIDTNFVQQIIPAIAPIPSLTPYEIALNTLVLFMTVSIIAYFLFLFEQRGILYPIARIGRWSMMIFFGATLGSTLLIGLPFNDLLRRILQTFGITL